MGSVSHKDYLEELAGRCARMAPGSKALAEESRPVLTDPALVERFRSPLKQAVFRIVVDEAAGARIRDVDGNEYIDMWMGFGTFIYGHNPEFVVNAIRRQVESGIQFGFQDPRSPEVARLLSELTGMDRFFFCNSGTEAIMASARIARALTGRDKIAILPGSYHGWADLTVSAKKVLGVPNVAKQGVLVLPDDATDLERTLEENGRDLACVIAEPIRRAQLEVDPRPLLDTMRRATSRMGIVLIFDEILTGFRLAPGGAQEYYGVRGDLVAYGKVLGGGMPIGVVGGQGGLMGAVDGGSWSFSDESVPAIPPTLLGGTFSKNPPSMAASLAVLNRMAENGGEMHETLNARTHEIVTMINSLLGERGVATRACGRGSLFGLKTQGKRERVDVAGPPIYPLSLVYYEMLGRGFYCSPDAQFVLSAAHSEEECEQFAHALADSVAELKSLGMSV